MSQKPRLCTRPWPMPAHPSWGMFNHVFAVDFGVSSASEVELVSSSKRHPDGFYFQAERPRQLPTLFFPICFPLPYSLLMQTFEEDIASGKFITAVKICMNHLLSAR